MKLPSVAGEESLVATKLLIVLGKPLSCVPGKISQKDIIRHRFHRFIQRIAF
jgi:hypothetical protein